MVLLKFKNENLEALDEVYRNAIVGLAIDVRRAYCARLVARCTFELRNKMGDKKQLRLLIKAAKQELKLLEGK